MFLTISFKTWTISFAYFHYNCIYYKSLLTMNDVAYPCWIVVCVLIMDYIFIWRVIPSLLKPVEKFETWYRWCTHHLPVKQSDLPVKCSAFLQEPKITIIFGAFSWTTLSQLAVWSEPRQHWEEKESVMLYFCNK